MLTANTFASTDLNTSKTNIWHAILSINNIAIGSNKTFNIVRILITKGQSIRSLHQSHDTPAKKSESPEAFHYDQSIHFCFYFCKSFEIVRHFHEHIM